MVEDECEREVSEDGENEEVWAGSWGLVLSPCEVEDLWVVYKPILKC